MLLGKIIVVWSHEANSWFKFVVFGYSILIIALINAVMFRFNRLSDIAYLLFYFAVITVIIYKLRLNIFCHHRILILVIIIIWITFWLLQHVKIFIILLICLNPNLFSFAFSWLWLLWFNVDLSQFWLNLGLVKFIAFWKNDVHFVLYSLYLLFTLGLEALRNEL